MNIVRHITFTPAARRQFLKNARSLKDMADRATKTGKKVNGLTADELKRMSGDAYARARSTGPMPVGF